MAPQGHSGKEPACQCRRRKRRWFSPCVRKIPWRRKWQPTPISLPGKPHGQRSWADCCPWACKESDGGSAAAHSCWGVGGPRGRMSVPASGSVGSQLLPRLTEDQDSPGLLRGSRVLCEGVSTRPGVKRRVAATQHREFSSPSCLRMETAGAPCGHASFITSLSVKTGSSRKGSAARL